MRRKDREVTDRAKIREILQQCDCCRLGLNDQDAAYVVPMNFGFDERDGNFVLYFHSARKGRKIELLKRNLRAAFEMDVGYRLHMGQTACACSAAYQCVMGEGPVTFLEEPAEKMRALTTILARQTGRSDWTFSPKELQSVLVFQLEADRLSCKEHL